MYSLQKDKDMTESLSINVGVGVQMTSCMLFAPEVIWHSIPFHSVVTSDGMYKIFRSMDS